MQNSQQRPEAETIVRSIWHSLALLRGVLSYSESLLYVLRILYAYHKGYTIDIEQQITDEANNYDRLYSDLIKAAPIPDAAHRVLRKLRNDIAHIDCTYFNSIYPEILRNLFDRLSIYGGHSEGEFYTPKEINKLIAYFLKKEKCASIYDPFCGTASISNEFIDSAADMEFDGQELSQRTSLYARVNLEANGMSKAEVRVCDSTMFWSRKKYDAVIACPPFNLRLANEQIAAISNLNPDVSCRSVEGMVLATPFIINDSKLSIVNAAMNFCSGGVSGSADYKVREYIVEQNLLDTVIALPSHILYGTNIQSVLFICKKKRMPGEPIRFVDARNCHLGKLSQRTLDVDRIIEILERSKDDFAEVAPSEIARSGYNLNPSLYVGNQLEVKEGQQIVTLDDLLTLAQGETVHEADKGTSFTLLSSNCIEILLNNSKVTDITDTRRGVWYKSFDASSKKYLLAYTAGAETRYGLFTDKVSFSCPSMIQVYEINESLVKPEYLVHILTSNQTISKSHMGLPSLMSLRVVIDSFEKQKEVVNKIIQEYRTRSYAEQEADAKRLGIKENISDLEHMLGSTQLRIARIIERLENATPAATNYHQMVKQLKDNTEYMNRMIQYSNANIDSESINKQEGNISEYINSYVDAWNNYGSNCFNLTIINDLEADMLMSFDKVLLTVMLDSILNNAARHGFNKRRMNDNNVQINLSVVEYDSTPYLLMSVKNNGNPMTEDFTIEDYISRGRYSAATGRSGLGGYHTYQIVKGHKGFLYLDSNKQWSVIVDILLPIDSANNNNLPTYEQECI